MATVRIYLPTYRRPAMLARALRSLRAQTFPDWICEVHNDAPDDPGPGQLVRATRDNRFVIVEHERNLGGTAAFNLFFHPTQEPFYTLHEDDNWWEPDFLTSMLETAARFPAVTVFWSNMRIWQEVADGTIRDTGGHVWPETSGAPRLMPWGHPRQLFGAMHSNGAALFRSHPGQSFVTPSVPFNLMEMFRERMLPHPLVFHPRPLAHFLLTRDSERARDPREWALLQTMLLATFLKHAPAGTTHTRELWQEARASMPPRTTILLLAALVEPKCRALLPSARLLDWFRFARGMIRRPGILRTVLSSRREHADWWTFLDDCTRRQFQSVASTA